MKVDQKILSIIAAQPGWVTRFKQPDGTIDESPVAVWAIVSDADGQRIAGFSETDGCGFLAPDDTASNFAGWVCKTKSNG